MFLNMKKYLEFLNEQVYEPDLRDLGTEVRCIKNYPNDMIYKPYFKKGEIYNIYLKYGNPQEAIEKYGINNYLPIECTSAVVLKNQSKKVKFKVNEERYPIFKDFPDFFKYFELLDGSGSRFRKKIINKGVDPFGEENWWETNEGFSDSHTLTENEVKEALKKYSKQLNKNTFFEIDSPKYIWCKGWYNKKIFISITKQDNFFLYFDQKEILKNKKVFRMSFSNFEDCEKFLKDCNLEFGDMEQYQKRRKITHTKEDPFDEEIWYEN